MVAWLAAARGSEAEALTSLTTGPVYPQQIVCSNNSFESWSFFSSTVPEVERQKPGLNRKTTQSQFCGYRGQTISQYRLSPGRSFPSITQRVALEGHRSSCSALVHRGYSNRDCHLLELSCVPLGLGKKVLISKLFPARSQLACIMSQREIFEIRRGRGSMISSRSWGPYWSQENAKEKGPAGR